MNYSVRVYVYWFKNGIDKMCLTFRLSNNNDGHKWVL